MNNRIISQTHILRLNITKCLASRKVLRSHILRLNDTKCLANRKVLRFVPILAQCLFILDITKSGSVGKSHISKVKSHIG